MIHEQTNGAQLTQFDKLIFTIQNTFSGLFDFVEVDINEQQLMGKENCLSIVQKFMQDYLQDNSSNKILESWSTIKTSNNIPRYSAIDALLKVRDLCQMPQLKISKEVNFADSME